MIEPESLTTGLVAQIMIIWGYVEMGYALLWLVVGKVCSVEVCILVCWNMFLYFHVFYLFILVVAFHWQLSDSLWSN